MIDACLEEIVTCRIHAGKLRFMQEDTLEENTCGKFAGNQLSFAF